MDKEGIKSDDGGNRRKEGKKGRLREGVMTFGDEGGK